jgi:hypothetical protein
MAKPPETKIECPFYITNKTNAIYCENCIPNTQSKFVFQTFKNKSDYIRNVCSCNQGKRCMHYRAMMILYERGVLNGVPD